MKKKNCWEFKKCGREPDGDKVSELGVCLACAKQEADGVNGGRNAGRICWVEAGTYCDNEAQGTFAQKELSGKNCDFFNKVKREEGDKFQVLFSVQHCKSSTS